MAEHEKEKPVALLKLGDRVKSRLSGGLSGKVVELRGPSGRGAPRSTAFKFGASRSRSTLSCERISSIWSRPRANRRGGLLFSGEKSPDTNNLP